MTSISCTRPESVAGVFTLWASVIVTGTASGPVGTDIAGTISSTDAWSEGGLPDLADIFTRGSGDPATTGWQYQAPAGAIGGDTLYFNVLTTSPSGVIKNFSFTASCPP